MPSGKPPVCPHCGNPVVRKDARTNDTGLWCPNCRSWLTPREARTAAQGR